MEIQEEQKNEQGKKSIFKNPLILGAAFLILLGSGYGLFSSGIINFDNLTTKDVFSEQFIALVNDEGIERRLFDLRFEQTKSEYQAQGINVEDDIEEFRRRVLVDVIDERLLIQYGQSLGITAQQQVIEEQYQQILSQFASEEEFESQLASQNIISQDIRNSISDQIILQELINQQVAKNPIEISEEEIRQVYNEAVADETDVPEFEEVKAQIEESLQQQKVVELMSILVQQLRSEGAVEIF